MCIVEDFKVVRGGLSEDDGKEDVDVEKRTSVYCELLERLRVSTLSVRKVELGRAFSQHTAAAEERTSNQKCSHSQKARKTDLGSNFGFSQLAHSITAACLSHTLAVSILSMIPHHQSSIANNRPSTFHQLHAQHCRKS